MQVNPVGLTNWEFLPRSERSRSVFPRSLFQFSIVEFYMPYDSSACLMNPSLESFLLFMDAKYPGALRQVIVDSVAP